MVDPFTFNRFTLIRWNYS